MKKINTAVAALCLVSSVFAQQKTVNTGDFSVKPGTQFSTHFDFENKSNAQVVNDGEMYFYGNYANDGTFAFSQNATTGYVVFEGKMAGHQMISGSEPSYFYNALFNKNNVDAHAFKLSNEIVNNGQVKLQNGVVFVDQSNNGAFVFLQGATHTGTSDSSHVNGQVDKEGNEAFKYPIGDGGYYRFASISAPASQAHLYTGEYKFENSNATYSHASKEPAITVIDNTEYWMVKREKPNSGSVILTLSWDEDTTPNNIYENEANGVVVVRWDDTQNKWVNEGGVVDYASKTVSTPAEVKDFGVFTLGRLADTGTPGGGGDLDITDGVSPNGDGKNDFFYIGNIAKYKNSVEIFNRWGRPVFTAENYDNVNNVFKGIAEGKAVVNQGEKLPTGTYYYKIQYLKTQNGANEWVTKVGHLHLETE